MDGLDIPNDPTADDGATGEVTGELISTTSWLPPGFDADPPLFPKRGATKLIYFQGKNLEKTSNIIDKPDMILVRIHS